MKKEYDTPTLHTEPYDVEDVVTASLTTVGSGKSSMEVILDLAGQIIHQNP